MTKPQEYELITILGPTASGKTSFAVHLADYFNTEIISADSRQVYRGMDIGTGKDLEDYHLAEKTISYHLIDICQPGDKYNVFRFQRDFHRVFTTLRNQGKFPILCGGTGLYIESVLKGYHFKNIPKNLSLQSILNNENILKLKKLIQLYKIPGNTADVYSSKEIAIGTEVSNCSTGQSLNCPAIYSLIIGIYVNPQQRREKITLRLKKRLENGMVEEIKGLLNSGVTAEELIYYGLEYKYITLYLIEKISYSEMYRQLEIAIHQFAKRQMTWFRGMERRGLKIHWIDSQSSSFVYEIFNQIHS